MSVFQRTAIFNETICGLVKPKTPTRLSSDRKNWTLSALTEEVEEFSEATSIEDEVDSLIDLIYFAAGRLQEMGVDGDRAFNAVHDCNMMKIRGELSKRPGSLGHDAVKPQGWTPPDYSWLQPEVRMGMTVRILGTDVVGTVVDLKKNMVTIHSHGEYFTTTKKEVEFV